MPPSTHSGNKRKGIGKIKKRNDVHNNQCNINLQTIKICHLQTKKDWVQCQSANNKNSPKKDIDHLFNHLILVVSVKEPVYFGGINFT